MNNSWKTSNWQPNATNLRASERREAEPQTSFGEGIPKEISPEAIAEISEKVYQLFLDDLRIARERRFRNR